MKKACYPLQDIARVTRQKNIERLKAYLEKPAFEEKENYADDLFKSQATTVTLTCLTLNHYQRNQKQKNLNLLRQSQNLKMMTSTWKKFRTTQLTIIVIKKTIKYQN